MALNQMDMDEVDPMTSACKCLMCFPPVALSVVVLAWDLSVINLLVWWV